MQINITKFFKESEPMNYSASVAEFGDNAGRITWNNANNAASEWNMLDDDDKRQAFREHVKGFGAWDDDEIASWSDTELNALFIQFVSGDMREAGLDDDHFDDIDWQAYEEGAHDGLYSGNIFKCDDGEIYYHLSS